MAYLIKALLGFAMFCAGLILFDVKLVQLMEIGTCASGNTPYAIRNPCPAGTGTSILLLMAGIFAAIIGAFVFALRGEPSWAKGREHRLSTYATLWGLGFTATGATALVAAITDDSLGQGGELAGYIIGGTFLAMGVPALLVALGSLFAGLRSRDERPMAASGGLGATITNPAMSGSFQSVRSTAAPRVARGEGDRIAKLKTLAELRQSGALTDQEFEREKARLLGES